MYKKTITYTDYNGNERTEEFRFHLRKSDIIDWLTTEGDYTLDEVLRRLVEKRNGKQVMKTIEDLIYRSYGEISLDGRQFTRTKEVKDKFMETEAYSVFFTELITNADAAVEFVKGIIPSDMAEQVMAELKKQESGKNPTNLLEA